MNRERTFVEKVQIIEAQLRGLYLSISCDLEFALNDVTCLCLLKDKAERDIIRPMLFEQTGLARSILYAEKALKLYNEAYYDQYAECFVAFKHLNKLRNKFAHSRINADPKKEDLNMLIFEYTKDGKDWHEVDNKEVLLAKLNEIKHRLMHFIELVTKLYQERNLQ